MNLIQYDNLSSQDLIAQYILEHRGKGTSLPLNDYNIISNWLNIMPDVDRLLLILNDIVPDYYIKNSDKKSLPSLKRINNKVIKKIREDLMRS